MEARKRMRVSEKSVGAVRRGVYVERGGANGRALDYWLEAAAELKRFLPRMRQARRNNPDISVVRQRDGRDQSCRRSLKADTETRKKVRTARR
jgi:hypothetical protein